MRELSSLVGEFRGSQPTKSFPHVQWDWDPDRSTYGQTGTVVDGPDFSAAFHNFAALWDPDKIVWYFDGVEKLRVANTAHIPHGFMYVTVTLTVGPPSYDSPAGVNQAHIDIERISIWQRCVGCGCALYRFQ